MRKLLTLFFVLISTFSFTQEIEWQNTIGGSGNEWFRSVIQANDGGYLVGGYSNSNISGDKNENCIGNNDYWIVKIDSNGLIQWQNTIGGSLDDYFASTIQTSDSGYLLAGYSWSNISGDKTENTVGSFDYWILKIDSIGNIQWQNDIGGNGIDMLLDVIQTADGGFLLGGTSNSMAFGDKNENTCGGDDLWIVKINASGYIEWQNTIGGNLAERMSSLLQTNDGGFFVSGTSASDISCDKTENSNGNFDFWILKLNNQGNIEWQNTIGGSDVEYLKAGIETVDGGFLLGGTSKSNISGDKSNNSKGFEDLWLVKLDSIGVVQWDKTIGGDSIDYLTSIWERDNGNIYLAGYSWSGFGYDKWEEGEGAVDYWVLKLDSAGNILWQNSIGGSIYDQAFSMTPSTHGGVLVGGYTTSPISGDKTEATMGGSDYWLVKIAENFNLIEGKAFADLNTNLVQEQTESSIAYLKITDSYSNRFVFSLSDGSYNLAIWNTGNYMVTPENLSLYNPVPITHTGNFNATQQIDSLNDFAFQPNGSFNDLCISISPLGNFRSGFNANYTLNYSNLGTTTLIPTIVFYPDNNVTFVSASITPTLITSDSVLFVLNTMSPFQTGQITITVNVSAGLPIGTTISSGAMILPIVNDNNPACNSSYWEVLTEGTYNPNDIVVNRSFLYDYEMTSPPDLEYIIRFQNTANDTAFTVKILNPLDTNRLDLSTLEMVATSHPADIRFVYHERNLEFVMNNILLPDSNINEPLSHGFVRYRIKPKTTVAVGDSIQNFAAIYFDFNNPVITNTAVTKIIQPTDVQEIPQGNFSIFPNPTNNKVTIQLTETAEKITAANVFNLYGQEVKAFKVVPTNTTEIDISDLSHGVYFIKLNNNNQLISKIVKY